MLDGVRHVAYLMTNGRGRDTFMLSQTTDAFIHDAFSRAQRGDTLNHYLVLTESSSLLEAARIRQMASRDSERNLTAAQQTLDSECNQLMNTY